MAAALARLQSGGRVVMATVLRRSGSAPSTPGQKLALLRAEEAVGSVGGGAVELKVLGQMGRALAGGRRGRSVDEPWVEQYSLGASMGMCCGGSVQVLFEVLEPALTVLVVGAGHIGAALAPLLDKLSFRVVLCDHRDRAAQSDRIAETDHLAVIHAEHDDPDVSDALGDSVTNAAALVMTHDHQLDQTVIEWALREGFAFVGGVGSRAKAARTRKRLTAKTFADDDISRVRMPLGVDISARSPAEIAVSIAAELVAWRADRVGCAESHDDSDAVIAVAVEG